MDATHELDYLNVPVNRNVMVKREFGGKTLKCLVVGFGLLCILQATLNISLRLYSQTAQTDEREKILNLIAEHTQQGWLHFNNTFYFISSTTKSWKDSRDDCLQRNADLVVINSREEQEFIRRWHRESWIGLRFRGTEGNWEWVDGTNITLSYWEVGEPNHLVGDEDCVEVWNNNWVDVSCYDANLWICEKKASDNEAEDLKQGWQRFGNSFYLFSKTKKDWLDSRNDCLQRNADLVVINSMEEQEFTKSSIGNHWIGLNDRETEGEWKWVDGSGITFRNWGRGEPNGVSKKEECAEQRGRTLPNIWNDDFCNRQFFWICEKAAGMELLEGDLRPDDP
ncbi:unnamed protein product [Lota lota]